MALRPSIGGAMRLKSKVRPARRAAIGGATPIDVAIDRWRYAHRSVALRPPIGGATPIDRWRYAHRNLDDENCNNVLIPKYFSPTFVPS